MNRLRYAMLPALALVATGCSEIMGGTQESALLDGAFSSMVLGYDQVLSSYIGGTTLGSSAWVPGGGPGRGHGGRGGNFGLGGGLLMGGGACSPGLGFNLGGHGRGGFVLPPTCTFTASSGRVVCPAETRNGLTLNRSAAYATAAGAVQQAFDTLTTNTVNLKVTAAGTITRRDSSKTTVDNASDQTIAGLAAGSTLRTVNGTSTGRETTAGTNSTGAFTAVRVMGDTIRVVTIPVRADSVTYPTAGTIIRSMQATVTYTGQTPTTSVRREVITYNGTNTATVVITKDGVTQNCTLALPRGRIACSN